MIGKRTFYSATSIRSICVLTALSGWLCLNPLPASALCGGPLDGNNFNRPLDYRDRIGEAANLHMVEVRHFTPEVEGLIKGNTGSLVLDIDYTLRQIPNHYRALSAMARYQLQNPRPDNAGWYTVECYFERALAFTPDDPNIYVIYAVYLHRKKDYEKALEFYSEAARLGLDTAEYHYNLGLLYFDMKDFAKARKEADKAYGRKYPLPGLKNKLQRAGKW